MVQKICLLIYLLLPIVLFAQEVTLEGQVTDNENNPISFVNVILSSINSSGVSVPISGTSTDEKGKFIFKELNEGEYIIAFSYIGYDFIERTINLKTYLNLNTIVLEQAIESLDETIIAIKKPTIIKEAGRMVFNVENTTLSTGNTLSLLSKTPGVLVIGDNISIKNSPTQIYLDGKRIYLSASEITSLLKNIDASFIKSIEVITIPSAKYDAEAGAVLNIITSKSISIGYKTSINGTYEQAIYPKYNFGISHIFKNKWMNFYGSYGISPRKEYKDQDGKITTFKPNGDIKSFWITDFNRTTKSFAHQVNIILDFTLNDKNSISITSNVFVSPNTSFNNNVFGEIFNTQKQLDSTFKTKSSLENDKSNLSFNAEYKVIIDEKGTEIATTANYIVYKNEQTQDVITSYFLPNGDLLRTNNFFTEAKQDTDIFTSQISLSTPLKNGDFDSGVKFSSINTKSGLEYFDIQNNVPEFNSSLSDLFVYNESIYAGYINYTNTWPKWEIDIGFRGEYTDVIGDSRSLGIANRQEYFELFPTGTLQYLLNENNTLGVSYARRIERPRYQSLNPFKYFLNDNSFNEGNPNLVPGIDNKYMLSYNYKNKWFIDAYYIEGKNKLSILTFQDNENNTLRNVDSNIISDKNYSIDLIFVSSLYPWWYLSAYTSTYYIENEFFSVESIPETYSNNTVGFYSQIYNGLTLSKDKTITSDISLLYISNWIHGSYDYKNQFNLSISFRKSFWNKRASITMGVEDLFNTYNIIITSRYYNQDNSYFAKPESRFFKIGFKYTFGNTVLIDNNRDIENNEAERLNYPYP